MLTSEDQLGRDPSILTTDKFVVCQAPQVPQKFIEEENEKKQEKQAVCLCSAKWPLLEKEKPGSA